MSQIVLHVAPQGHPQADGSAQQPFGTLEAARDALRAWRARHGLPTNGARIVLQDGDYWRAQTLELGPQDGGREGAPVVWCAAPGARPRLLGGRRLTQSTPVTDPAILARLPEAARAAVRQYDLRAHGLLEAGKLRSRGFGRVSVPAHLELFLDGQPLTLARWPNDEYLTIAAPGSPKPEGDGHGGLHGLITDGFYYNGDRPRRWQPSDDLWVHGYWAYDWANTYERVASINHETRLLVTAPPHGLYGFRTGQRFYFLNVLEELDCPGEYWVDQAKGRLYLWPPAGTDTGELLASELETPLLGLTEVAHLRLEGLALAATRGQGVVINAGRAVELLGCTLTCIGNSGVTITGGVGHRVADCDMTQLGDHAVNLSGGDRATLTPCDFTVHNNHLHHFGHWSRTYVCGVLMRTVGARITHNLIHDAPHTGILYHGNDNLIAGNELHSLTLETGDCGSIYGGRDYAARGNEIRGNYLHHSGGMGMGSMGIYWDDCISGQRAVGNVFQHLHWAVFMGGGRELEAISNLFLDCSPGLHLDARGLSPAAVWQNMVNKTMYDRLVEVNWRQAPYAERYPALAQLEAYFGHHLHPGTAQGPGVPPGNNLAASNLVLGGQWADINWLAQDGEHLTQRDNLILPEDSVLRDAANGDFRPRPGATLPPGYTPPDLTRMGLVHGPGRPALARVHAHLAVVACQPIPGSVEQRVTLRLSLRNLGDLPVHGALLPRLTAVAPVQWLTPLPAVSVAPGAVQELTLALRTPPQSWRLELAGSHPGQRPARVNFNARWHLPRLATTPALAALDGQLAGQAARSVRQGDSVLAELRAAATPSQLALWVSVNDQQAARPEEFWRGSCVEVFAASKPGEPVRQLIWLPPVAPQAALCQLRAKGEVLGDSQAVWQQTARPGGYELAMLIPWAELGLPESPRLAALEVAIGIAHDAHGHPRYMTMDGNANAYRESRCFVVAEFGTTA